MASASSAPNRDFQFFVEIIDAFKVAGESADEGKFRHMKVEPFAEAMTMFLRIFDAFSNPFFSDIVKKDVQGNIDVSIYLLIDDIFWVKKSCNGIGSESHPNNFL